MEEQETFFFVCRHNNSGEEKECEIMAWALEYLSAASAGRMPAMKVATEVPMTKMDQHSTILNRVEIGHRGRRSDRLALYLLAYCLGVGKKTKQ